MLNRHGASGYAETERIEQRVAARLRTEQLTLVCRQVLRMDWVSPLVGAVVCIGLWSSAEQRMLLVWLGLLTLAALLRQALALRFRRLQQSPITDRMTEVWERRFMASVALVGLLWGVGGWQIMPAGSLAGEAFVFVFVVGMSGGAAATYAVHPKTVAVALSGMLAPSIVHFLWRGETMHLCMAFGGAVLLLAAPLGVRIANDVLRNSLVTAEQLDQLARVDPLSGLANRRAVTEAGEAMVSNALRAGHTCAVLMIDVDQYKAINDLFGHAAGGAVIAALGRLLALTVREGDTAGRMGGDEFAVLLPEGAKPQARVLAERILDEVRDHPVLCEGRTIPVRLSIGVADSGGANVSLQTLLTRADAALYQAKADGRDRVVEAPDA